MTGKDTHTMDEAFFDWLINKSQERLPQHHRLRADDAEAEIRCVHPCLFGWCPPPKAQNRVLWVFAFYLCPVPPDNPTHCMTKAVIIAISKSIAIEFALYVRSVVIAPSMGNTGMMQLNLGPGVEATPENIMGRAYESSDVASTVAFLASDNTCYLTGNVVEVDGGHHI
ncbi:hypothetical protein DFH08DRAFT_960211 [Mycena albidolilacea]|uniref:Uncharacterized protein n=1 Tax=Mycena albidolilacea TaxID=1033008 RepID=A0AAD7ERU0_9AGAR|nr:hypothetical protein DFH08DRAFT_960211 [Mycena albidolilacea]